MWKILTNLFACVCKAEMEPGHGSPGHRVTGSAILTGRVGFRVNLFGVQTRCCDPVLDRVSEPLILQQLRHFYVHSAELR